MSEYGYSALSKLRYRDHDEAMRGVAATLRGLAEDYPSHWDVHGRGLFLSMLARMIDPDAQSLIGWPKLVVKHAGPGAPKARDDGLGLFMWAHIDVLGEKTEATLASAEEKYGAKRTRALEALATERGHAMRLPEVYVHHADDIKSINDLGAMDAFDPPKSV